MTLAARLVSRSRQVRPCALLSSRRSGSGRRRTARCRGRWRGCTKPGRRRSSPRRTTWWRTRPRTRSCPGAAPATASSSGTCMSSPTRCCPASSSTRNFSSFVRQLNSYIIGDKKGAVFGGLVEAPLRPIMQRKYQAWFRELPEGVLDSLSPEQVLNYSSLSFQRRPRLTSCGISSMPHRRAE